MVTFALENQSDIDRIEIEESFNVLDSEGTGRLDFELAYSLLLGLGYITDYKKGSEFTRSTLEEAAKQIEIENCEVIDSTPGIKLETLLSVVATHPALKEGSKYDNFAKKCFELMDQDQKGCIIASDVERLGRDIDNIISTDEANEIIETTNKTFAAVTTKFTDSAEMNVNQLQLQAPVFEKIFAPSR